MKKVIVQEPYSKYITITICLTLGCNFRCSYCYQNNYNSKCLDLNKCLDYIKAVQDKYPNKEILLNLIGGEITLIKDIKQFILKLFDLNIKMQITTNGGVSNEWWDDIGYCIDALTISYHHEFHNEDSFFETCKHISTKIPYNLDVSLMITPDKFDTIYAFGERLGTIPKVIVHAKKLRKINGEVGFLDYTEEQKQKLLEKNTFKSKLAHQDFDPFGPQYIHVDGEKTHIRTFMEENKHQFEGWKCYSGIESFDIDSQGNISGASCGIGRSLGSIYGKYDFPTEPIICTKKFCFCLNDLVITKEKNILE